MPWFKSTAIYLAQYSRISNLMNLVGHLALLVLLRLTHLWSTAIFCKVTVSEVGWLSPGAICTYKPTCHPEG